MIPTNCYSKLIVPLSDDHKDITIYQNMDMTVIDLIIQLLNDKLDCKSNLFDVLSPIFTCLIQMCRAERIIRKYVRMQV